MRIDNPLAVVVEHQPNGFLLRRSLYIGGASCLLSCLSLWLQLPICRRLCPLLRACAQKGTEPNESKISTLAVVHLCAFFFFFFASQGPLPPVLLFSFFLSLSLLSVSLCGSGQTFPCGACFFRHCTKPSLPPHGPRFRVRVRRRPRIETLQEGDPHSCVPPNPSPGKGKTRPRPLASRRSRSLDPAGPRAPFQPSVLPPRDSLRSRHELRFKMGRRKIEIKAIKDDRNRSVYVAARPIPPPSNFLLTLVFYLAPFSSERAACSKRHTSSPSCALSMSLSSFLATTKSYMSTLQPICSISLPDINM